MKTAIGIVPLPGQLLVDIFDRGNKEIKLAGGKKLWLPSDDDMKGVQNAVDHRHPGIRPRFARVLATSTEAEEAGISVGDEVLIDTLEWSRGVRYARVQGINMQFWRVFADKISLVSEQGRDEYLSDLADALEFAEILVGRNLNTPVVDNEEFDALESLEDDDDSASV